jgi:MerR family redox-sensitive transcriptional activator SoxR
METLSIGEVARRAGLRQSAIRYYESVGLLPQPERASGWRRYTADTVERLQVIRAARDLGFALEEIRTLLYEFEPNTPPPERWRALAAEKLPAIDALISRAMAMRHLLLAGLNCQCTRIEECFLEGCEPRPRSRARSLPIVAAPAPQQVGAPPRSGATCQG